MQIWQAVVLTVALCSMLGGCPDAPSSEATIPNEETEQEQADSNVKALEIQEPPRTPVFSLKEYVDECTSLTRNQLLCIELGRDLQHTFKDNITENSDDVF